MKKTIVIHPILFAIYPILFLFTHNIALFLANEIFLPLLINSGLAFMLWFLFGFLLKNKEKSGLLTSLSIILFFSYGHVYNAIKIFYFSQDTLGLDLHVFILPVWGLIFIAGLYFFIKSKKNLNNLTNLLNIVAVSLIIMSIVNISFYKLQASNVEQINEATEIIKDSSIDLEKTTTPPNIYYIILDGYARNDILEDIYQHDNTEFTNYLTEQGFYIANKSTANYAQTALSLASSLNFSYLDDIAKHTNIKINSRTPLKHFINNNKVVELLKQHGYTFITYSPGYYLSEIKTADIYKYPPQGALSEFQNLLINTTPLPLLLERLELISQHDFHRGRVLYIFNDLPNTTQIKPPIFVFAHILLPHPPFVFTENGEATNITSEFALLDGNHYMDERNASKDDYRLRYKKQLMFVNKQVKESIAAILATSPTPPIIILQSDHGPGSNLDWENADNTNFKERMSILNAYYLPHQNYTELYNEITPVNTFRLIFNDYFNTDYEMLDDESYFSTWPQPYIFINVTDEIK